MRTKKSKKVPKRKRSRVSAKKVKKTKKNRRVLKPKRRSLSRVSGKHLLNKSSKNPIITPKGENDWESFQTFNPAAMFEEGKMHLLYRALGADGMSRLGYASSKDGVHIDYRSNKPAYIAASHSKFSGADWIYSSGGGWSGCEDPRITKIDDDVHMLYVAFDATGLPRLAMTKIKLKDFLNKKWKWKKAQIISPPGVIDKSGVLFPEKVKGKYAIMHRVFPNILIDFVDSLDFDGGTYLQGEHSIKVRKNYWDSRKIGAGAPPIKTKYGWLLIYYGVDDRNASQYKIGAMVLDLKNPTKVLYRSPEPILEPSEWYENHGHKSGVAYPCGAGVIDGELFIYYGGADSYVCAAHTNLEKFLQTLMHSKKPVLWSK